MEVPGPPPLMVTAREIVRFSLNWPGPRIIVWQPESLIAAWIVLYVPGTLHCGPAARTGAAPTHKRPNATAVAMRNTRDRRLFVERVVPSAEPKLDTNCRKERDAWRKISRDLAW